MNGLSNGSICVFLSQYPYGVEEILRRKFPDTKFNAISIQDLHQALRKFPGKYFRYFDTAVFLAYDLQLEKKPLLKALVLLWISKKNAYFVDMHGQIEEINLSSLVMRYLPLFLRETVFILSVLIGMNKDLRNLSPKNVSKAPASVNYEGITNSNRVAYFRTDHWFGYNKTGGSVAHISGVANGFMELGYSLFFLSTDTLEFIDESKMHVYLIKPETIIKNFQELPELEYNRQLIEQGRVVLLKEKPTMIYQRYSLNNYAGAYLSKELNIPFVLEYNGSFLWIERHWGKGLSFPWLTRKIELANLHAADLIIVVAKPMKDELEKRGIPGEKILINPNGVNPDRFRPGIDGSHIRRRYGIDENIVVGFIGTFGKWHGAEILAEAVKPVIENHHNVHFLFVGDGPMMPEVKQIIARDHVDRYVTLTGMVSQDESPQYLAACDMLVSPHVPNPDGSPFFGSPTKLFEYMAMGKPIVASALGQIAEVLENKKTALLVEPGNVSELAEGIVTLLENPKVGKYLGMNARKEVCDKYTWDAHVKRTLDKCHDMFGE